MTLMCRSYVTPDSCPRLTAETAEPAETKSLNHREHRGTETQRRDMVRRASQRDARVRTRTDARAGRMPMVGLAPTSDPAAVVGLHGRPTRRTAPRFSHAAFLALCVSVVDSSS